MEAPHGHEHETLDKEHDDETDLEGMIEDEDGAAEDSVDEGEVAIASNELTEDAGEDDLTVHVRLNADLRRRLRRMAQRQGVRPDEVARLLLAEALMNPAGDPVDLLRVRVDQLEKRVNELATAGTPADQERAQHGRPPFEARPPRRDDFQERPRFGSGAGDRARQPRNDLDRPRAPYPDRGRPPYQDRPARPFNDRPSYARPRDFDDRAPRRREFDDR